MARPRVILASSDAEAAVRMIAALNPKRYRVEHIFDISEALLRAKIVLAHCLVVHGRSVEERALKDLSHMLERVTPVIVSDAGPMQHVADELGARFVPEPFEVHTFKRAVYRAVSKTQERRHRARSATHDSHMRAVQRVLLLYGDQMQGAVMAAVLRNQLGATCDVATAAREMRLLLEEGVDCVVAQPELLLSTRDGAEVASILARRGIPVVPLAIQRELDVSSAGQVAWDIAPQVRRSLLARNKIRDAS